MCKRGRSYSSVSGVASPEKNMIAPPLTKTADLRTDKWSKSADQVKAEIFAVNIFVNFRDFYNLF